MIKLFCENFMKIWSKAMSYMKLPNSMCDPNIALKGKNEHYN